MAVSLTVLGSSAALPAKDRSLSAHLLELDGMSLLFDCGEGTQFQLKKYKKKLHKIEAIFISHLHGDHFFGLPGLLSTMHMLERSAKLSIYGPKGLKEAVLTFLELSNAHLTYELEFVEVCVGTKTEIRKEKAYRISAFPLQHSVPTYGYMYEKEAGLLNVKKDFVKEHAIPNEWFARIKSGEDYVDEQGERYLNSAITEPLKPPVSYAYCSDTAFFEQLADWVKGVRLLYHESTFLDEEELSATEKKHATAGQAAMIAKRAGVGQLLLGHFSARYKKLEGFRVTAQAHFKDVILGVEGLTIELE